MQMTHKDYSGLREAIPFYIFVTVLLVLVGAGAVGLSERMREQPLLLVLFVLAMLVHVGLYWLSPFLAERGQRWRLAYVLAQAGLAMSVMFLSGMVELFIALLSVLIGEALGVLGNTRLAALTVAFYITVALAGLFTLADWQSALQILDIAGPTLFFIGLTLVLYNRQSEARERAQELLVELETANCQLADYAAQVAELTLNVERQRLARELHDTLAQGVAGLILQLEAVKAHIEAGRTERAGMIVEQALGRARNALAEARSAIDDLRTGTLPDLAEAIRQKTARFSAATSIPCKLELDLGAAGVLPPTPASHVSRLLDEALANVARHAQAQHVWVRFVIVDGNLEMTVRDDGAGFDLQKPVPAGHHGLLGMRERARLAGGVLSIESAPQQGTTVHAILSLSSETNLQPIHSDD